VSHPYFGHLLHILQRSLRLFCSTVNKMCEEPGCYVRPSFKFPGGVSQRCARHMLPGMVGNNSKSSLGISSVGQQVAAHDVSPQPTKKRARGEVLKMQREQLMMVMAEQILAEAEADAKTTVPEKQGALAPAPQRKAPAWEVELDHSSTRTQSEEHWEQFRSSELPSIRNGSCVVPQRIQVSNMAAQNAPESDSFNSSAPAALQQSFSGVSSFLTQRGAPIMLPTTSAAAAATQRLAKMEPPLPALQLPYGAPGRMDFQQVVMAHNALLSMTHSYGLSHLLPNFNPWTAVAASLTPANFANAFAACQFLNSTPASTRSLYPFSQDADGNAYWSQPSSFTPNL